MAANTLPFAGGGPVARKLSNKETQRAPEDVQPTVRDRSGDVAGRLAPLASSARNSAADPAVAARQWATPRVLAARRRVSDDVIPRLVEATNSAIVASKPVRDEAMARHGRVCGTERRAGDDRRAGKPKRHRGRNILALLGLASAAGAAVAWWRSQQQPVAPWEEGGSASPSTAYPATGSSTDSDTGTDSGASMAEPPGPVLATSAVNSDGDNARDATGDLTTPSTAMGTTSESTSADPAGESTSQSPAINDVTTMDAATAADAAAGDTRPKSTRSRTSRSFKGDAS